MTDYGLPDWHSTFAANADTATATVHTRGALDLLTLELLRGTVAVLSTAGQVDITIDLADLASIDHAGLLLLGGLAQDLDHRGGSLTLTDPRPTVRRLLTDAHLPVAELTAAPNPGPGSARADPAPGR